MCVGVGAKTCSSFRQQEQRLQFRIKKDRTVSMRARKIGLIRQIGPIRLIECPPRREPPPLRPWSALSPYRFCCFVRFAAVFGFGCSSSESTSCRSASLNLSTTDCFSVRAIEIRGRSGEETR